MRPAGALVTVGVVSAVYLGPAGRRVPATYSELQRPTTVVLTAYAILATVALAAGQHPHERGLRLLLAALACGPIVGLRRARVVVSQPACG